MAMPGSRESTALAHGLIAVIRDKEGSVPDQLTPHADCGSSIHSRLVAMLLADLSVAKSHGRVHTSDDKPYSEAQQLTEAFPLDFAPKYLIRGGDAKYVFAVLRIITPFGIGNIVATLASPWENAYT